MHERRFLPQRDAFGLYDQVDQVGRHHVVAVGQTLQGHDVRDQPGSRDAADIDGHGHGRPVELVVEGAADPVADALLTESGGGDTVHHPASSSRRP